MVSLGRRLLMEGAGTGWIVFVGCGSTVLAPQMLGPVTASLGMPLGFGLALAIATYVFGRHSGGHFNPAVTVGCTIAQCCTVRDMVGYIVAQCVGAIAGAALLAWIASGRPGFELVASRFGANGYGDHSPLDYALYSAFVIEALLSFVFVTVHLVRVRKPVSWAAEALMAGGVFMTACLLALPVTNASINPARSTGSALLVGDWALDQLWLFWAAPLLGGALAGLLHPGLRIGRLPSRGRRPARGWTRRPVSTEPGDDRIAPPLP